MSQLSISAGLQLKAGKPLNEALLALKTLVEKTQHEPNCYRFEIYQHNDNPQKFTLWECWKNQEALDQHFQMEHTKQYLAMDFTEINYIEKLSII